MRESESGDAAGGIVDQRGVDRASRRVGGRLGGVDGQRRRLGGADARRVRSPPGAAAEARAAGTRLKVVARAGVGLDNVDVSAATRAGVTIAIDDDAEAAAGRLEQELVLQAQKMDADEELDRLGGHVAEIRRVLERQEPVGRRLDFLMQELNREANTLGSKSVDGDSSRAAVELKVLIEQMREQVQNVE